MIPARDQVITVNCEDVVNKSRLSYSLTESVMLEVIKFSSFITLVWTGVLLLFREIEQLKCELNSVKELFECLQRKKIR